MCIRDRPSGAVRPGADEHRCVLPGVPRGAGTDAAGKGVQGLAGGGVRRAEAGVKRSPLKQKGTRAQALEEVRREHVLPRDDPSA